MYDWCCEVILIFVVGLFSASSPVATGLPWGEGCDPDRDPCTGANISETLR